MQVVQQMMLLRLLCVLSGAAALYVKQGFPGTEAGHLPEASSDELDLLLTPLQLYCCTVLGRNSDMFSD